MTLEENSLEMEAILSGFIVRLFMPQPHNLSPFTALILNQLSPISHRESGQEGRYLLHEMMVLGQDNPAALSNLAQPVSILDIGGTVVVVNVEHGPCLTKCCDHAHEKPIDRLTAGA